MLTLDELKQKAALASIDLIDDGMIIGVGSGSTVHYFINALDKIKHKLDACVASSVDTANRLKAKGIPVIDMNAAPEIALYFDGADEINLRGEMKKGGGGALTREKIIATYAKKFICLIDESKLKNYWGDFPVAVEVIPMARSAVARELLKLPGSPVYREGFVSDNGNIILDVYQLDLLQPEMIEAEINQIVGVVENGIFGKCKADEVFMATQEGIKHWCV
jgi:ribose 5-phosphate isomerase A